MNKSNKLNQSLPRVKGKEPWYKKYIKNYDLILLLLPGLLLLILFKYVPMYGLQIAFKDFRMMDGMWKSPWIGFDNFKWLFDQGGFGRVFFNTLRINVLETIIGFVPPVLLAIFINEIKHRKFKRIVQTLTYLPHFFSWVILSGILTMIFSSTGPVNDFVKALCGKPIEFFADGSVFIAFLVGTHIWKGVGWSSILFLAAITGIDETLYDAASVDGAGRFKQIIHITLPCIIPTMVTVLILSIGTMLDAGFDQIYNLYNPMVYDVADVIDTYVLRTMQGADYAVATAAGLFKSVIAFVLVVGTNKIVNKMSDDQYGLY